MFSKSNKPIPLKEILQIEFKKHPDHQRASFVGLESNYLIDKPFLTRFLEWHKTTLPTLEHQLSAAEKLWIEKLHAHANTFVNCEDFSQANLMQLFIVFLTKYPFPGSHKLITDFGKQGHCVGFAFLVSMSVYFQFQPKNQNMHVRYDWDWVYSNLLVLVRWNKKSEIDLQTRNNLSFIIKLVHQVQHSTRLIAIYHSDMHLLFQALFKQKLEPTHAIAVPFSKKYLKKFFSKKIIEPIVNTSVVPATYDLEFISFHVCGHNSTIIRVQNSQTKKVFHFYTESNHLKNLIPLENLKSIKSLLDLTHGRFVKIADEKKVMRIYAFSTKQLTDYPSIADYFPPEELNKLTSQQKADLSHAAICTGNLALIQFWLNNGIGINHSTTKKLTLLMSAADRCQPHVVHWLCNQSQINLEAETLNDKKRALHYAALSGVKESLQILLSHHVVVDAVTSVDAAGCPGWTPLAFAVQAGHVEAAKQLLDAGANIQAKTADKRSLLHIAVEADQYDAALLLIQRGVDIFAYYGKNQSAFDVAKSENMRELLVSAHLTHELKKSPLKKVKQWFALYPKNKLLHTGQSPLALAVMRGCIEIVFVLIDLGADLTLKDVNGKIPLDYATHKWMQNVLQKKMRPRSVLAQFSVVNSHASDAKKILNDEDGWTLVRSRDRKGVSRNQR